MNSSDQLYLVEVMAFHNWLHEFKAMKKLWHLYKCIYEPNGEVYTLYDINQIINN